MVSLLHCCGPVVKQNIMAARTGRGREGGRGGKKKEWARDKTCPEKVCLK
jgi:hypothetical protein